MGGIGSGRWWRFGTREKVEDSLTLDINRLVRQRLFQRGIRKQAILEWRGGMREGVAASLSYRLDTLDDDNASVLLDYKHNGEPCTYTIRLTYTASSYGGKRMWFMCPIKGCNRRVATLHSPPGGKYFGCRQCYDLAYETQSAAPRYRLMRKAQKIHHDLGGEGIVDAVPKPKGMHWRTYHRKHERMLEAWEISLAGCMLELGMGRGGV